MPDIKTIPIPPEAEACRQALLETILPYADELGTAGMLVVASALVGQLIALQDQRRITPAMAVEIVARNIELANSEMLSMLIDLTAGHA